jgi:CDP-diacylglycerol---glycerol-3-phosphate 3-phosphatidyltransferase
MNVPNLLTILRLLLVPIVVILYYLPVGWAHFSAALLFALAAVTDWLDGYLARNLKQMTKFGAFLDPVADKLMVAVALVLVVGELRLPFLAIPAAIIVGREIVVSALREWMAELGKRTSLAVTMVAKIKTMMQMSALILLLLYRQGDSILLQIVGSMMLYVAAALTLWSMIMYLKIAWPDLTLSAERE